MDGAVDGWTIRAASILDRSDPGQLKPIGVVAAGRLLSDGARATSRLRERFFAGRGEVSASNALARGVVFWLAQALVLTALWTLLTPRV
jgi:hypothetical protein